MAAATAEGPAEVTATGLDHGAPAGDRRARLLGWLEAGLVVALLGWLVLQGALALDYRWQWYRVWPYLVVADAHGLRTGPLLQGLLVTLALCGWSFLGMLACGIAAAVLQLVPSFTGRLLARAYVELVRNTPLLVQLYLLYFVAAPVLRLDRFVAGVVALSLFEGAYAAEIVRAGILAVPAGQREAAMALGLSAWLRWRLVILPQALRSMIPPLAGQVVLLVKHSALVSVLAIAELTTAGRNLIADTFLSFEIWFTVAAIYLALTITLSALAAWLERRCRPARS